MHCFDTRWRCMLTFSSHRQFTCFAQRAINKRTKLLRSLLSFSHTFPRFFLSISLSLSRFTDQVDPSSRVERPRSTLASLTSEFSAGFRSASAAAAVARRTRADTRSSGGYDLKGRRARFNKSNTTDRQMKHARTENGATKRARANTSLLLPVCLPACLPACLLPGCLVRRRTARGPHVVCLASGLFTCWLSVYAFPSLFLADRLPPLPRPGTDDSQFPLPCALSFSFFVGIVDSFVSFSLSLSHLSSLSFPLSICLSCCLSASIHGAE